MAKKLIISLMFVLSLAQATSTLANLDASYKVVPKVVTLEIPKYPKEVVDLKNRIVELKKTDKYRYRLEYKSEEDLLETLNLAYMQTRGEKDFGLYKVTAIMIKESKLNHRAINPVDGGKGLMMAMPKYWKHELPWYKNPYNKKQSICAGVDVLRLIKHGNGCSTWEAIRRYNGTCAKTYKYVADVKSIFKDIRKA